MGTKGLCLEEIINKVTKCLEENSTETLKHINTSASNLDIENIHVPSSSRNFIQGQ